HLLTERGASVSPASILPPPYMARTAPTEPGGLYIGRRPGTAPVHYASEPEMGSPGRRRADRFIAAFVLVVETLVCLTLWGPQPVAWLWVGSQVDYHSGSVSAGIVVAFAGMIATLMLTLVLAVRLDAIWKVVRRAAGYDQREGALARIFMVTAIVAAIAFGFWFLILEGPAPSLAPR
ncbi:MAG: hypothetical protein QOC68_3892, partial [Solirubrobacteraceae bacterium]|nr:hypothetical protein [Solirubrobacteraceae bacterium]